MRNCIIDIDLHKNLFNTETVHDRFKYVFYIQHPKLSYSIDEHRMILNKFINIGLNV